MLRLADLLRSNTYGDLAVHRLDYVKTLKFIREVMDAMTAQIDHLRAGIKTNFGSL